MLAIFSPDCYSKSKYSCCLLMTILCVLFFFALPAAPDGSPLNLAVQSVNSTSLTLSWEPPSLTHQNGGHFNYTLTCISPADSGLRPLISVFTTAGAHTLNGLMPATLYACSVFAANLYGHSPPANVSAMTDGRSMCIAYGKLI